MAGDFAALIIVLLFCALWVMVRWHRRPQTGSPAGAARVQRLLKPRPPDDCPACHQATAPTSEAGLRLPVQPWREIKSRRGAPKRINTPGFACPNRRCHDDHITDADVHAVVGAGPHGRHERIQTFRCQACNTTCSARLHTPLYRLKTRSQREGEVLTALAEGLDISAAARVVGHRHATMTTTAGSRTSTCHMCNWTNSAYASVVTRTFAGCGWRLIRSPNSSPWCTSARTQGSAHAVVHALRQRLAPDCLPLFTSDGLNHSLYALTAHVGQWTVGMGQWTCQ